MTRVEGREQRGAKRRAALTGRAIARLEDGARLDVQVESARRRGRLAAASSSWGFALTGCSLAAFAERAESHVKFAEA